MNAAQLQTLLAEGEAGRGGRRALLSALLEGRLREAVEQREALARARQRRRREDRVHRFVLGQNAELAAACGACVCWGHPRCPTCHGEGGPGWRAPDPERFTKYIEPALRRLGLLADETTGVAGNGSTSLEGDDHGRVG
jgi:hypothetical protein